MSIVIPKAHADIRGKEPYFPRSQRILYGLALIILSGFSFWLFQKNQMWGKIAAGLFVLLTIPLAYDHVTKDDYLEELKEEKERHDLRGETFPYYEDYLKRVEEEKYIEAHQEKHVLDVFSDKWYIEVFRDRRPLRVKKVKLKRD